MEVTVIGVCSRELSRAVRVGAAALLWVTAGANAQGLELTTQQVASGLSRPVGFVHAGDGSGRSFIVEQTGRIRILAGGAVLAEPFLDLSGQVSSGSEQGLLGLAFHPAFATNGRFFVNYTDVSGDTVVSRFQVSGGDPNLADPASEEVLLTVAQPFANHNAGDLAFGPDGDLYLTMGDGGSGGDPGNRAQDLGVLLGKILRIDVDSDPAPGLAYAIPPDNPFVGDPAARDEIWAYGLRNPWRISFDRATGDLFIADVGQSTREEVNFQPAASPGGENYGWKVLEGTHCHSDEPEGACQGFLQGGSTLPVLEYDRVSPHCSVTGGYRYRGAAFPQLDGVYLFGDFCSGWIWGTVPSCDGGWESQLLLQTGFNISAFGEDEAGEVYVVELAASTGRVHRLELAPGSGGPRLIGEPEALDFGPVPLGQSATLELTLYNDNAGPEALHVDLLELAGDAAFSIDLGAGAAPCLGAPLCLGPGEHCTLEVTFEPQADFVAQAEILGEGNTPALALPVTGRGYEPCAGPETLVLEGQVLEEDATFVACREITTGPGLQVAAPARITLRAGERVILGNGTRVGSGAALAVVIDPVLVLE